MCLIFRHRQQLRLIVFQHDIAPQTNPICRTQRRNSIRFEKQRERARYVLTTPWGNTLLSVSGDSDVEYTMWTALDRKNEKAFNGPGK